MSVIIPIVHLNGTSKERLIEQLEEVGLRIAELEQALCESAPNGRDYYPKPGLMEKAEAQHYRRLKMIGDLREEVFAQLEGIVEQ